MRKQNNIARIETHWRPFISSQPTRTLGCEMKANYALRREFDSPWLGQLASSIGLASESQILQDLA